MKFELAKILAVGAGGFFGASGRYLLSIYTQSQFEGSSFPFGTLAVNLLGCLLIGLLAGLFEVKGWMNQELRLFIFVGILGGFTTFSTFAHESLLLLKNNQVFFSFLNIGIQVIIGLIFIWLGYQLVRIYS